MAIYRTGQASMSADGVITGVGTKWKTQVSLIRAGATIIFMTSPLSIAVIQSVVSDTQIKAMSTDGKSIPLSNYAILLSDSLTVDGLAQDIAETLRYYQGKESEIARFVDIIDDFDWDRLEQLKADVEAAKAAVDADVIEAANSADASEASRVAADQIKTETQEIKDSAVTETTALLASTEVARDEAIAAQAATEAARDAGAQSAADAKASADKAEDLAESLDATNLLKKEDNLSDVADRAQSLKNLFDGKPVPLPADGVLDYDAVTMRQLKAASGGSGGATMNGVMNNFIGAVEWFNGSRAALPAGYVAADGQLLNRTAQPDLWKAVESGILISTTEAIWLDDGTDLAAGKRGKYTKGNGTTTFRVPDLNGVQARSFAASFLRGDAGGNTTQGGEPGDMQPNGLPDITGTLTTRPFMSSGTPYKNVLTNTGALVGAGLAESGGPLQGQLADTANTQTRSELIQFQASRSNVVYGRAPEVRPNSTVGIWIIRSSGAFNAASTNFNVISGDATKPANGVVAYGGEVNSTYQVAGADYGKVSLRVRNVIGGDITPEIRSINSSGTSTTQQTYTFPSTGGQVLVKEASGTIQGLGTAATRDALSSTGKILSEGDGGILTTTPPLVEGSYNRYSSQVRRSGGGSGFPAFGSGMYFGYDNNICFHLHIEGGGLMRYRYLNAGYITYDNVVYSTANTTKSSDGTLKAASPVARIVKSVAECTRNDLVENGFAECGAGSCNAEAEGVSISRMDVGVYVVTGSAGLAGEGWRILPPRDPNGSGDLGIVEAEQTESGGITVRLYKRRYKLDEDTGDIVVAKGALMDVPENSWIDIRMDMPEDSAWNRKQKENQPEAE